MWSAFTKRMGPKTLTAEQVQESLPWVVRDGVIAQLLESLTAGPILIALALLMKAPNALIGYMVALPLLSNLAQFPGAYLTEKIRKRKLVCTVISAIGRASFFFMAWLALFPQTPGAAYLLALLYTVRYFASSFAGSAWNSWMKDLVPPQTLGRFFSKRLTMMVIASLVASLTMALILKIWPFPSNDFYGILAFIAFLLGIYSIYVYYRIQEPPMEADTLEEHFFTKIKKVFKDRNFSLLMVFLGFWNFSINLAVPFFSVYILEQLKLSVSLVLILVTVSQVTSVLVMGSWGKLADMFSNKSVLLVTCPLYVLAIFLFLFTSFPVEDTITIPLLVFIYMLIGISQSGVTLATGNITLKLAPKGSAAVYLSVNGMVNAFMAGIAPIIGGFFADYFIEKKLSLILNWTTPATTKDFHLLVMQHWDFFFFMATVLALLSLSLLKAVKEEGEVNEKVVISSFLSLFSRSMSVSYQLPQKVFLFLSRKKYKDDLQKGKQEVLSH